MPLKMTLAVETRGLPPKLIAQLTIENIGPEPGAPEGTYRYRAFFGDAVDPWSVVHRQGDGPIALLKKVLEAQPP